MHTKEANSITCYTCKKLFKTFSDMIEHRRIKHPSTKKCNNFPNCERGDRCLYIHEGTSEDIQSAGTPHQEVQGENNVVCRICKESFGDKNAMMNHRKRDHLDKVGVCKNIANGLNCRKGPLHCWYKHEQPNLVADTTSRSTQRNTMTAPESTLQNFPFGPAPQGAVVGHNNMELHMIQQTLHQQQQQMSVIMTEIMRLRI